MCFVLTWWNNWRFHDWIIRWASHTSDATWTALNRARNVGTVAVIPVSNKIYWMITWPQSVLKWRSTCPNSQRLVLLLCEKFRVRLWSVISTAVRVVPTCPSSTGAHPKPLQLFGLLLIFSIRPAVSWSYGSCLLSSDFCLLKLGLLLYDFQCVYSCCCCCRCKLAQRTEQGNCFDGSPFHRIISFTYWLSNNDTVNIDPLLFLAPIAVQYLINSLQFLIYSVRDIIVYTHSTYTYRYPLISINN